MPYRSRWQRVEERRNLRKAVLYLVIGLIIIVLFITYGLKILAGVALLIDNLKASGRTISSNDLIPPAPPRLWADTVATNSSRLKINGSAEAGSSVYITVNGESESNLIVSDDGMFSLTIDDLNDGKNVFQAVAIDSSGNKSQKSNELSVFFSQKKPSLNLSSPTDGQSFSGDRRIEIKGQTDKGVRIWVNSRISVVDDEGKFVLNYFLNDGENLLIIRAINLTGNEEVKELKVVFNP